MKKITFFIMLAIYFNTNAQVDQLTESPWNLLRLSIDSQNYFPPENNEVDMIVLTMLDDGDAATQDFSTGVCNSLTTENGTVNYINDYQFTLPQLTQTLISCDMAENSAFEQVYFDFFYDNQTTPFSFDIIYLSDAGLLTIQAPNGDFAEYDNSFFGLEGISVNSFKIHPNPVSNLLTINTDLNIENATILTMSGQIVASNNTNTINTSQLAKGSYFLKVTANGSQSIKQFIKE
ncbi:T9SS type A sorting domain-containing protein [Patiriisocius marinus]|uniref:T9SS type A sorting domain-containing protein n=1 Tax=Patiriisocius marinus TaxID=1397112 RepID=UPI00232E2B4D|nr:T9SS type A sorting domain-containing protein [Patiriisocius marinus]